MDCNRKNERLMVSVRCATYNQASFIRQCLDGLIMQKTDFRYEVIVHDDASTDGTTDVVREYANKYPNIIKPLYEEANQFSVNLKAMNNRINGKLTGKYIAICEGDDYWIDANKLQKQVEFLEMHPEYSMCFHRAKILKMDGGGKCFLECEDIENREYDPNELFLNWKVPTASMVFKREAYEICNIGKERVLNGDIVLVLNCASIGKIYGMSDEMSVYRVHQGGVTYNYKVKRNRRLRYPDHYRFIKENYPFIKRSIVNKKILRAVLLKAIFKMPLPFEFIYRLTGR